MQYIDHHTTTKTNIQRQNDPTTLKKEWPTTNRYAVHNDKLKGFRVRLDFAEKDFIELDQWSPRCSSIRTDPSYKASPPRTISTPFPDEVEHKRSSLHKTEKPVIANHSEIRLISLGNTIVVTRRHDD